MYKCPRIVVHMPHRFRLSFETLRRLADVCADALHRVVLQLAHRVHLQRLDAYAVLLWSLTM